MASAEGSRELVLGLAREDGFNKSIVLKDDGGWKQSIDLSSTRGISNFHDTVCIQLPDTLSGKVHIALEDGGIVSSAKWVVAH